jgi:hypothetical protein
MQYHPLCGHSCKNIIEDREIRGEKRVNGAVEWVEHV